MRFSSLRRALSAVVFSATVTGTALFAASMTASTWTLDYGKGSGQVSWLNAANQPNFQEPSPLGPLSVRVHGDSLWVADSIAGRVLCIDQSGKPRHQIKIPGVASNTLLEDFALVQAPNGTIESIWVGDGADLVVRKIRVADGCEIARCGGLGGTPGLFTQIHQIEVGQSGHVYVGDFGRGIVAVFSADGKLLREQPWERSGFAVDSDDRLSLISWSTGTGYALRSYDSEGRLFDTIHLGHGTLQNPHLWLRDEASAFVSFIPQGGYRGIVQVMQFGIHGQVLAKRSLRPPLGMHRYLNVSPDGVICRVQAEFERAPKGRFTVSPLSAGGDR
ncbi:MAG: hypothetical protein WA705_14265 [Candidatus Ozemobacteraceae bacterium]